MMEGPLKYQEDFEVAPVIGVSGVATTGQIWAESQKIIFVIGGSKPTIMLLINAVS